MVASVRQLRRRIRSVENTAKITQAMSMIAASKMRRTQEAALRGRPYADNLDALLADLAAQPHDEDNLHPLLRTREVQRVEVILITPDRGLTGGLNANIIRAATQFVTPYGDNASVVAVGRKGRDFMVRYGRNVRAVFTDISDRPPITDVTPIARLAVDAYENEEVDAVHLVYAQFVNTTVQRPTVRQLLPVIPAELRPQDAVGYIYEPFAEDVLARLLPRFIEAEIYHALLEGIASEQSARMVAMRSATDAANEMVDDLTLVMNKARQESITTELLDIVSGAAAVE
ncbi:MAG: ATP synthase F1 subunit gamma [SAR202 cluster bacterium]|jgi:F-type H+-transporting ATPase subunit gamma|nr:ATP synthase F1 subunit gamma [Chloroflexota bacterium]MDP6422074.1 ATP synthase F1 subunit gamma [SAR202 cluster bacterium]HAL47528.1 ATP synthase F1 subunit gamma [Dehalococcoidia bacterium]MDP6663363.1 ATP synthase F1 subunit gamma [SAR202 cluster bacterium]MDP6799375.1 ATP synthase F1 subunit gamma [SAR202 cluster bacterium]|tara:strand:- start:2484 stop:3344 length:861 start_codon:yes stop_codon:yes gene_type:complete